MLCWPEQELRAMPENQALSAGGGMQTEEVLCHAGSVVGAAGPVSFLPSRGTEKLLSRHFGRGSHHRGAMWCVVQILFQRGFNFIVDKACASG